ncbi:LLM class flavin-dependent oxidoreductase [Streptomyces sp. NPDC102394]|uniref:LLM class flavin-dependent oxidoreductase n=1 Tax=Streptomyces sp. NPDC102394 TaxID=3366167 RepID=UPI00380E8C26
MGYVCCWTAEHHGSPGFAGCAPEILTAVVLGRTRRMRVGTGGVLLPRYSPAKAAEVFSVPASVFPGRVDLGPGRSGGPAHDYPQRVRAVRVLLGLDGADPLAGGESGLVPPVRPQMWLLGAQCAGRPRRTPPTSPSTADSQRPVSNHQLPQLCPSFDRPGVGVRG